MNKVKEKRGDEKPINSRRSKKCNSVRNTKSNGVIKEVQHTADGKDAETKLTELLDGNDEDDFGLFKSCEENVYKKLETILFGLKSHQCNLDGDQIRKRIQEEKCVSEESLQNIKLFFADIQNSNEELSSNKLITVASKYLRIFIDILEVAADNELDFVIQACDLVITVHQYFFVKEILQGLDKFIAMLHHVVKQLYKKQNIDCIVIIIKNIINFLHIAGKRNTAFSDESRRSFCMIHQMCYSLYYKELQKLIKFQSKDINVTSYVELRICSLVILAFSNWCENKFIEHSTNFICNESVILVKSCTYDVKIIANSISDLLNTLYKLIELESQEKNELMKSLLNVTWKLTHLYINFCILNRLQNEISEFFDFIPMKIRKKYKCLSDGITILQNMSDLSKLISQEGCICSRKEVMEQVSHYPALVKNYYNMYCYNDTPDVSRLFDMLNLLKVSTKEVTRLCGGFINTLLEVVLFVTDLSSKISTAEKLKRMVTLLSFLRGLLVQIQSHLFPDSKDEMQCYRDNEELRSNFDVTYNNYVIVLQSFLGKTKDVKHEDIKWLSVLYKIGIHYYNQKQYDLTVPSLKCSIFLSKLCDEKDSLDSSGLKEMLRKYNVLGECYSKLGNFCDCSQTYLDSIKLFGKLSPEGLTNSKSLLEMQVTFLVKKRLQSLTDAKHSRIERSLFDDLPSSDGNNAFLSMVLDYEFYCYKKFGNNHDIQSLLKRLLILRKDLYEKDREMLKYALCMIEMSTSSSFEWDERIHWCTEAVGMVEEFYANLEGSEDEFEWHVRDVLAVSFFQRSVIQYEVKVAESMEKSFHAVNESLSELNDASSVVKEAYDYCLLEEDYMDDQFISSLNAALALWIEVAEKALDSDHSKGDLSIFYDAEGSAKCLYHSAVLYSLLSQNLNSVKASYVSGLIYQMLSLSTGDIGYKEKQVESWLLTASQFLLVKNVASAEMVVEKLHNCMNVSLFSKLHIEVLKAACLLYCGNIQSSAESFHHILSNEILNDNTKSSLVIKSDIYFLLTDLKLITVKEENGEMVIPLDQHFPMKSPFPPISDCLRYLRSLYLKYVDRSGTQGTEVSLSSNWAYLDKLLICLTRNAELLKHQGSILEAKTLLREGLLLTQKYHLSLRSVEILQHLASMDLVLCKESSFLSTFGRVQKILGPTVQDCFGDSQILAPDFLNHISKCSCNYCMYPKLQEIHIMQYLQYIEGKQRFSQLTSEQNDEFLQVIDTLVENAYERYKKSWTEVYRVVDACVLHLRGTEALQKQSQPVSKKGKKQVVKKKSKSEISPTENKELFNLFLRYSLEAKINKSIIENQNMISTVEQLFLKAEMSDNFQQTHYGYHRLRAQLYRLRSILYLGEDIVEKVWISPSNECKQTSLKNLCTPKTPVANQKEKKRTSSTRKKECQLITEETPRPGRKGRQKKLRKGKLNVAPEEISVELVKHNNEPVDSSHGLDIMKCVEDLQNSLSVLNPYTDALIIKGIYQLLMLLSGTSNKDLTIACQLLSASRTLHQQILSSNGRKLRDLVLSKSLESTEKGLLEKTSNLLEKYSGPKSVFDPECIENLAKDHIPQDWCVCSISLTEFENKQYLIICRLQSYKEPTVIKINLLDKPQHNRGSENVVCDLAAAFDNVDLLEKFNSLIDKSQESMKITDKSLWWAERVNLDKELKCSISRLEDEWLQGWKGMLFGQYVDNEMELNRNAITKEIAEEILSTINHSVDSTLIECLVDGFQYCTKYQILDSLQMLFGEENETVYEIFAQCLEKNRVEQDGTYSSIRKPVVLILDKTLQKLPWESMSIFQDQPVTRMPSFLMTSSHCKNYQDLISEGVRLERCCYVLNPKDDLKRTEEKFADWFRSLDGWHGIVGRPPTQTEYSDAISENDLFIYCGHGSGQEYLGWSAVNRLQSNAVALLMGCSSGRLTVQGELEAHGMVLYYLSAGCPAVVANLWHVTDKDIDMFLETLLKLWMEEEPGTSLAECVSKARRSCKLKYLNGAAPVVYGLPLCVKPT